MRGALPRGTDRLLPGAAETRSVASEGVGAACSCRSAHARRLGGRRSHGACPPDSRAGLRGVRAAPPPSPRPSPVPSLSPEAPRAARPAALPSCPGVDLHVVCAVLSSPTLLHVAVMCFYAEHPCLDTCAPLTRGQMGSVWGREAGRSRGLARTPLCLG